MKKRFLSLRSEEWDRHSDEYLIQAFKSTGENIYFAALFQRYLHLVYGACRKYITNAEDCKDLTMDVFETALRKLPHQNIKSFNHWIYTVTRNTCIDKIRQTEKKITTAKNWKKMKESEAAVMENEALLRLSTENNITTTHLLEVGLAQLSPPQRKCVALFFLEKQSYKQIEMQTGFNAKQVKSYLQNGKRRLQIIISQYLQEQENLE
jgi:RNA polymerase sigma-70 factor (ECF subfamily)